MSDRFKEKEVMQYRSKYDYSFVSSTGQAPKTLKPPIPIMLKVITSSSLLSVKTSPSQDYNLVISHA